jgi:hypothetical protein
VVAAEVVTTTMTPAITLTSRRIIAEEETNEVGTANNRRGTMGMEAVTAPVDRRAMVVVRTIQNTVADNKVTEAEKNMAVTAETTAETITKASQEATARTVTDMVAPAAATNKKDVKKVTMVAVSMKAAAAQVSATAKALVAKAMVAVEEIPAADIPPPMTSSAPLPNTRPTTAPAKPTYSPQLCPSWATTSRASKTRM